MMGSGRTAIMRDAILLPGLVAGLCAACSADGGPALHADADAGEDAADASEAAGDVEEEEAWPEECGFRYDELFAYSIASGSVRPRDGTVAVDRFPGRVAYAEPLPAYTYVLPPLDPLDDDLVMPGYEDDMPLFERAGEWTGERRCYELPGGTAWLTEPEAYDMYRAAAEATTGVAMDARAGVRTVVGLRGAYPGTFAWHGNLPDRFNDTLVLLWVDLDGTRHVREFPVTTDVGAADFGPDSSSFLRPNRRYRYLNDWHRTYNALHIDESDYRVRDDTNNNGHWDSDRNGWLPPSSGLDHDRTGGGHNIHMGSVDAPLGSAVVDGWSAGCQVIPGMANWVEFVTSAWTGLGDPVDYFLIDVRDIPADAWHPCTPDGSHACPFRIGSLPFVHAADTSTSEEDLFDAYSCADLDESGPEVVYALAIDASGALSVTVECEDPVVDVDVHLLDGDDPAACLARAHMSFTYDITPGRYLIVVDTYVEGTVPLSGPYTLTVDMG
jgi:hypothetical protein